MAEQQLWTLSANGEATPWFDTRGLKGYQFQAKITPTLTLLLEGSNDPNYQTKSGEVDIESYTSSVTKVCDGAGPRFVRFRVTSYTSGSAIVSFGSGISSDDDVVDVRPESKEPSQATS